MAESDKNLEVGLRNYTVVQDEDGVGRLIINFVFFNPSGNCRTYADFLEGLDAFLESKGYQLS